VEAAKAVIVAAKAGVEAAKAQVATATLNLGFTRITSPIEGIAGIATAQVGDLVGPNSGPLTTVSTVDPIKVYFTVSEREYLRAVTSRHQGALLVPQRAVTELQGRYQVAVVDRDNTIAIRTVKVGERIGTLWIIDEGLQPGERVVAEGVQKVRPGMVVHPRPFVAETTKTGGN
jgi:multidrug efflux pump subunit AcrA (membrane-fusion protein)